MDALPEYEIACAFLAGSEYVDHSQKGFLQFHVWVFVKYLWEKWEMKPLSSGTA